MVGTSIFLVAAAVGIDPGWERLPDGGWRYYIQLDEENLKALRNGEALESDVPPQLEAIRSYRIVLAGSSVPRDPWPSGPKGSASGGPSGLQTLARPALATTPPPRTSGESASGASRESTSSASPERPSGRSASGESVGGVSSESAKPWWPLSAAIAAACACFAGMLYTGWLAWDYRQKYQQLWDQMAADHLSSESATGLPSES